MAVNTSKKVVLGIVLLVAYFIGNGVNNQQKYDELKSKPASELTDEERDFVKETEDARQQAEQDRSNYQAEEKKKAEADRPRRALLELQAMVRSSCEETASSTLNYPKSYEHEQHEDGFDERSDGKYYFFTLHYSGVNSFNVRSVHTIECYGKVGDIKTPITYKIFK